MEPISKDLYDEAKAAGFNDEQIAVYLSESSGYKAIEALEANVDPKEIIDFHLRGGFVDEQIAVYLSESSGYKAIEALEANVDPKEIIDFHLRGGFVDETAGYTKETGKALARGTVRLPGDVASGIHAGITDINAADITQPTKEQYEQAGVDPAGVEYKPLPEKIESVDLGDISTGAVVDPLLVEERLQEGKYLASDVPYVEKSAVLPGAGPDPTTNIESVRGAQGVLRQVGRATGLIDRPQPTQDDIMKLYRHVRETAAGIPEPETIRQEYQLILTNQGQGAADQYQAELAQKFSAATPKPTMNKHFSSDAWVIEGPKALAKGLTEWGERYLFEHPGLEMSDDVKGVTGVRDALQKGMLWKYVAAHGGESAPQLLTNIGINAAATIAGAPALGFAVSAGMMGAMEAGGSYNELIKMGVSQEDAADVATVVGMVNGILEQLPMEGLIRGGGGGLFRKLLGDRIMKSLADKPKYARRLINGVIGAAGQIPEESITEGLQEIVGNAAKAVYDENQSLVEGVPTSMLIGAVLGGFAGGGSGAFHTRDESRVPTLPQETLQADLKTDPTALPIGSPDRPDTSEIGDIEPLPELSIEAVDNQEDDSDLDDAPLNEDELESFHSDEDLDKIIADAEVGHEAGDGEESQPEKPAEVGGEPQETDKTHLNADLTAEEERLTGKGINIPFIKKKVAELGSVEAVAKNWDDDTPVSQYARALAQEIFTGDQAKTTGQDDTQTLEEDKTDGEEQQEIQPKTQPQEKNGKEGETGEVKNGGSQVNLNSSTYENLPPHSGETKADLPVEGVSAETETAPSEGEASKEPWQMQQNEFVSAAKGPKEEGGYKPGYWAGYHKSKTRAAVEQGQSVSVEVLQEYAGEKWADEAMAGVELNKEPTLVKNQSSTETEQPQEVPADEASQDASQSSKDQEKSEVDTPATKSPKLATKLRLTAKGMQKQIDNKRNPGVANQNPTARRANIANSMMADADRLERIQNVLNGMADDAEAGTLPEGLENVNTKSLIEQFAPGRDRNWKNARPWVRGNNVRDLLEAMAGKKGIGDLRKSLSRFLYKDPDGRNSVDVISQREIEALSKLVKESKRLNAGSNWDRKDLSERLAEAKRMFKAGITNEEQFDKVKAAIDNYIRPKSREEIQQEKLRKAEQGLIGIKMPGFFPTPKAVIDIMLEQADIKPGMTVLEPSAGKGDIAEVIQEQNPEAQLFVAEISIQLSNILDMKGFRVADSDFMTHRTNYDRIVMNPPFENGHDIDHVRHAYELLNDGGKVVAIMGEGGFFRDDKKATGFREWLEEVGGTSEKLPEKSFTGKDAFRQTGTATRMVVIEKASVAEEKIEDSLGSDETKETDQGITLFTRSSKKQKGAKFTTPMITGKVLQVVENLKLDNAPPIAVTQSESGLPQGVQDKIKAEKAEGEVSASFYQGKVWICADNIHSASQVRDDILHEVTGHFGLRGLLGDKLNPVLDQVAGHFDLSEIADTYGIDLSTEKGRRTAAEEKLAFLQQDDSARNMSFAKKIYAQIRKLLRQLGFFQKMTDADIALLLTEAYEFARNGKPTSQPTWSGAVSSEAAFSLANHRSIIVDAFRDDAVMDVLWQSEARSGPFDGGCLITAKALQRIFGGEIVRLQSKENEAEHYGIRINDGSFMDADGVAQSAEEWVDRFSENEMLNRQVEVEVGVVNDGDIPDDPKAVKMLEKALLKYIGPGSIDDPRFSRKAKTDTTKGKSLFPEVQERLDSARGAQADGLSDHAKNFLEKVKHGARHFPLLDPKQWGNLTNYLRVFEDVPNYSKYVAEQEIKGFIKTLDPAEYDIFRMNIILADMLKDVESGLLDGSKELPFGYQNREQLETDIENFQKQANEKVKLSLDKRKKFMDNLKRDLVKAKLLNKDVLKDEAYYHHQVLQYLALRNKGTGTSTGDVRLKKKGWQKGRTGSTLDYNTEYVEAEFTVIAQGVAQLETKKVMDRIDREYNSIGSLRAAAKEANTKAIYKALKYDPRDVLNNKPEDEPFFKFRKNMAIAFDRLGRQISEGEIRVPDSLEDTAGRLAYQYETKKDPEGIETADSFRPLHEDQFEPGVFRLLSYLINKGDNGAMEAAMIFKAMADRKKFVTQVLGDKELTWENFVDKDKYDIWTPKEGSAWFMTNTISDKIVEKVVDGQASLQREDVKQSLARGANVEWVLPVELADTLDNFRQFPDENVLGQVSETILNRWKQWILINPYRYFKYNLNNMSGDLDIVFAYQPEIISKHFSKAAKDLFAQMRGEDLSPELQAELKLAMQQGVNTSSMSAHDIPDITKGLEVEKHIRAILPQDNSKGLKKVTGAAKGYWLFAKKTTAMRENILRLAAFRFFQAQLKQGKQAYGVSPQYKVKGVTDKTERAAMLARDLLGDYGNLSQTSQWLRKHLIPFWSWQAINAPRYVRLFKNMRHDELQTGKRGTAKAAGTLAWTGGKLALKTVALFAMVNLWNMTMFPDEEEELGESGRRQLHLILGRRDDGSIISIRFQGALSDALSWFAMEDIDSDIKDLYSGKSTWGEKAKDAALAPVQKIVQASRPLVKTAAEATVGLAFYPDFLSPRPVRDKMAHILRTFSMDKIYNLAAGKPMPDGEILGQLAKDLLGVFAYSTDPGVTAYYDTRKQAFDFMEKETGKTRLTVVTTDKSNALYYYKQALRLGDVPAAEKYLKKYVELGGKPKYIKTSIKAAHPFSSIPKRFRRKFIASLTPKEKVRMKMALDYYRKAYWSKKK